MSATREPLSARRLHPGAATLRVLAALLGYPDARLRGAVPEMTALFAEDGVTPLAGAAIRVTSLTDRTEYGAETDANGRFTVARLPVGNILIEAVHLQSQSRVFVSEPQRMPKLVQNHTGKQQ